MTVLGLSFGYHDSTVAIVKNSEVIYAGAEQQFSRQKHDSSFPHSAIERALKDSNLTIDDIDYIVYHENPYMKFSRVLVSAFSSFPFSRKEFVSAMKIWLGKRLWVFNDIHKITGIKFKKIAYLNHHSSHAAQAYLTSGFEKAGCLVIDAVGDWSCTSLYDCRWEEGKLQIKKIKDVHFPNSLGLLYSSFTSFLGFQPNSDECSIMALAAFGKPSYLNKIEQIATNSSGEVEIREDYLNFSRFFKQPFSQKFIEIFGAPRPPNKKLPFSCFENSHEVSSEDQRFADIAASIQVFFEKYSRVYLESLKEETGYDNLCLAGGGALNCVNNTALKDSGVFKEIHIPADPGDGGTAFGCALYFDALKGSTFNSKAMTHAYLGSTHSHTVEKTKRLLEKVKVKKTKKYAKHGQEELLADEWLWNNFDDMTDLSKKVAQLLVDRKIVGWIQGRNEIGPRALGNRSILIRPDDIGLAKRLSAEVKDRAPYRPYALSMSEQGAKEILDIPEHDYKNHKWMQYAAPVKKGSIDKVCAGIHIDNTTRPQICSPGDNQFLFQLLNDYGRLGNCPEALINTSFNESGYPMVQNYIDAMVVFARTTMDCLVIGTTLIQKGERT